MITEREAIKNIQYAIESIKEDVLLDVDFIPSFELAIEALEKQSMVNEFLNEAEQYKLALFAVLRTHSMDVAMEQGLSTEEHSMLAVKIMQQVVEKCNFVTLKVLYDEALAKMGGK